MRVLHVTQGVGGGITRHIVDIVANTPGIDHHLVVPPPTTPLGSGACYDEPAIEAIRRQGVTVDHIPMSRSTTDPLNLWSVVLLRRLMRRIDPSVVHAHSSIAGAVVRLASIRTKTPVVYTPHGFTVDRVGRIAERALAGLAARLVAVSNSEARVAMEWQLTDPDRITIIPNGIDLTHTLGGPNLRRRLGIAPDAPLIGTVARLVPQKAPDEFVRVAGAVACRRPDAHFLLVGMGPLQEVVDAEVAKQGIAARFHQLNHLDDAASILDQLDVFVLPSRYEGGPYAVLEAMRAGTPVVLSDVVGNTDAVEHGFSGMLIEFGKTGEMANAVVQLLEDEELRYKITEAARRRLRENFDVKEMGISVNRLYREVVSERERRSTRRLPHPSSSSSTQFSESSAAL